MRPLLVCGTANIETVLRLDGEALPTCGGVFPDALSLNVSGIGVNLARGLTRLGSPVRLLTLAADDPAGQLIGTSLGAIKTRFVPTRATPQTLALVRPDGMHTFYRDPGNTPEAPAPAAEFLELLPGCGAAGQCGLDARTAAPGAAFRYPNFDRRAEHHWAGQPL